MHSLTRLSLLALASTPSLALAQSFEEVTATVPNSIAVDDSGWYYSDRLGYFYTDENSYPWTFVEGSEWWYTSPDGWWYAYSVQNGPAPDTTLAQSDIDAIRAVLTASMEELEIPGVAYAIKFAGQPAFTDALGVKSLETEEPLDAADRFRIGSASKTFTGMAILQLIGQELIGLDIPISTYLPDEVLSNYDKDAITIRMLLQHTSGVSTYTNFINEWNFPYILERTRVWTNEELVEIVNSNFDSDTPGYGIVFTPGAGWSYSNTNTVLLGMIVEAVTGRTIHEYINTELVGALGLADTYYPAPGESEIAGQHTQGYIDWVDFFGEPSLPTGMTDATVYDASGVGPAGPIISNVEDLAIWAEALALNRRLISSSWQQLHVNTNGFVNFTPSIPSVAYGLQLVKELDQQNQSAVPNIAHRGQIAGYDTVMIYLTEVDCAIVLMCNRTLPIVDGSIISGLEVGVYDMFQILFPEMVERYSYADTTGANAALEAKQAESTKPQPFGRRIMSEY